jgi:hypothetical protein
LRIFVGRGFSHDKKRPRATPSIALFLPQQVLLLILRLVSYKLRLEASFFDRG